jgi:NADH-quinone oxidoreductase subunit N
VDNFQLDLVLPVAILTAYALLGLVLTPLLRERSGSVLGPVSLLGLGMTGWALARQWQIVRGGPHVTAGGFVRVDSFGVFVSFLLLAVTVLTVLGSSRFLERESADRGEFCPLVLLALAGMIVMVQTSHLLMVLVGLEVFSLALYVLTGLTRMRIRSIEAALKYFLLGAFSSGFLVYGMALLYGVSGSLDMHRIGRVAAESPSPMLWIGIGLVLVAFSFKIAVVPFHHWVPDVYEGAPTNVTAFMAAATKTAAFAALLRLLAGSLGDLSHVWVPLITVLAILTMTVANLVALAQTNIKRLLAFSSISHAGYLLIAVVSPPEQGVRAIFFYLSALRIHDAGRVRGRRRGRPGRRQAGARLRFLAAWSGLGWRRPALGIAMSLFLFSMAGIPPTAGFFGKYVIFQSAVRSGHWLLAVVGVVNAVIGAFYYLKIVVAMWMGTTRKPARRRSRCRSRRGIVAVVALSGLAVSLSRHPTRPPARDRLRARRFDPLASLPLRFSMVRRACSAL